MVNVMDMPGFGEFDPYKLRINEGPWQSSTNGVSLTKIEWGPSRGWSTTRSITVDYTLAVPAIPAVGTPYPATDYEKLQPTRRVLRTYELAPATPWYVWVSVALAFIYFMAWLLA